MVGAASKRPRIRRLPFSGRAKQVELDCRRRLAITPDHLELLASRNVAKIRKSADEIRTLATRHAELMASLGGRWGDVSSTNFAGEFDLALRTVELARVVRQIRSARSAWVYPQGARGFDTAGFLETFSELCAHPACALSDQDQAARRGLVESYLKDATWIVATKERIGTSYIYWYGHCSDWFIQSADGSCLRVAHCLGESC